MFPIGHKDQMGKKALVTNLQTNYDMLMFYLGAKYMYNSTHDKHTMAGHC